MFKRKKKESEEQHLKCSIDKLIAIIVVSEIDHKHQIKKKIKKVYANKSQVIINKK